MGTARAHATQWEVVSGRQKKIRVASLIRFGYLCEGCTFRECEKGCPSELEPALVECPICGGDGCDECDGGEYAVTSCPKLLVDSELVETIELAGMYEKGLPPVEGGVLDQSHWFAAACRFIWSEQARLKRMRNIT